ncbi:MAG: transglycosylase SLT domain-containing protein [Candidatus Korobacteraceae bacterium]
MRTRNLVFVFSVFLASTLLTLSLQSRTPEPQPYAAQGDSSTKAKQAGGKAKAKSATKTKSTTKNKTKAAASKTARARRSQQTIAASSDLQPMARRLLDSPSSQNYAAVEAYAQKHSQSDSGALAWLAAGYTRHREREFDKAIAALKNAQPHAGELADYVAYFLGSSYFATGDASNAAATLKTFEDRYPDSLFLRNAVLDYARALIVLGEHQQAAALLGRYRDPIRADVEITLARALFQGGNTTAAAPILRNLYYTMPLADESAAAGDLLKSMKGVAEPSFAERRKRADLLAQGGRSSDAIAEYRQLQAAAGPELRADLEFAIGRTLRRAGRNTEARRVLEPLSPPAPQSAERLYYLVEIARSDGDPDRFHGLLQQLRESAPTSRWLEQALLSAGNMYLLKPDYDRAIDYYRELRDRFPQGDLAPYTHWKASWLALRQGRKEEARQDLEQLVARYPGSGHISNALYWRARIAEDDRDTTLAWAWYQKLTDRFPNYYYADRARERLSELKPPAKPVPDPVLERIPPVSLPSRHREVSDAPAGDPRLQKSRLLQNAAMYEFAARELQSAADHGANWAIVEMADMYNRSGLHHQALRMLKRTVPSYFAVDLDALPRPYWESLFPRPFWNDLERFARSNQLDPFLVASLIRQESEFNPGAVSRARALGLMQLLPTTGRQVARQIGVGFSSNQLLSPTPNLRLGTKHFRDLLDRFGGKVEYALAAYNAGAHRVDSWLENGPYRDTTEFVESIPFTETREYVQAIMRNATVYRKLYEDSRTANASSGDVSGRSSP